MFLYEETHSFDLVYDLLTEYFFFCRIENRQWLARHQVFYVDRFIIFSTETLDSLLQQENNVIEFWTVKKKKLEQCHQYVLFEQSAKQVNSYHRIITCGK